MTPILSLSPARIVQGRSLVTSHSHTSPHTTITATVITAHHHRYQACHKLHNYFLPHHQCTPPPLLLHITSLQPSPIPTPPTDTNALESLPLTDLSHPSPSEPARHTLTRHTPYHPLPHSSCPTPAAHWRVGVAAASPKDEYKSAASLQDTLCTYKRGKKQEPA
ncbi:hypothetical protein E2C01_098712 [Portunus trituberculatus]|uniref:Uncharacterized protein n=1 Tax=Portunus trituberculatus TaxID=210409 RepID=A0A5B7K3L7_PORTR|nr:hypothetical protein [Portunus trituberculatus]